MKDLNKMVLTTLATLVLLMAGGLILSMGDSKDQKKNPLATTPQADKVAPEKKQDLTPVSEDKDLVQLQEVHADLKEIRARKHELSKRRNMLYSQVKDLKTAPQGEVFIESIFQEIEDLDREKIELGEKVIAILMEATDEN